MDSSRGLRVTRTGFSVHLLGGTLERYNPDQHESSGDSDFEQYPEHRPDYTTLAQMCREYEIDKLTVRWYAWKENRELRGIRVVCFAEIFVVCYVPCMLDQSRIHNGSAKFSRTDNIERAYRTLVTNNKINGDNKLHDPNEETVPSKCLAVEKYIDK